MQRLENQKFEIELDGFTLKVQDLMLEEQVLRIVFPDDREPLMITEAYTEKGKVWVSLPCDRQMEAEWIGAKIVDYLKNK